MELLRALAVLLEPPTGEHGRVAEALGLPAPPPRTAHSELFDFQLYPYASVYLGAEGMLGGEARDRIAGFWRALGEEPPKEPDHLAVLLAFWAQLEEAEAAAEDSEAADRWRHVRTAFLFEHLVSWLPVYLDKLVELAPPFYRQWAEMLGAVVDERAAGLEASAELPLHLREAPPVADPRTEGADAFLDSLLAPVRSGLVLVRSDLERAARELELGGRVGERRFVLKALFGQDSAATLGWLSREADRWRRRHSADATRPRFWADRAATTARLLEELAES